MRKIRVGLLIDNIVIPFWAYKMVENIVLSEYAEVVLVVKKKTAIFQKRSFFTRVKDAYKFIIYRLYKQWENKKYKHEFDAFENKDLTTLISSFGFLEVECVEKRFSDYVSDTDIAKISEYNVDVFIRLGFRILRGSILNVARMGVWSYHHGDNLVNRGGPAGFWEYFKKEREIGSILQILTEDLDGGEVLYRSWSTVHYSHTETLNAFYWKTSLFIPRKLKELYETGEEQFLHRLKSENSHLHFYSNELYTLPHNPSLFNIILGNFWKLLQLKVWKQFNFEQWILLYHFNNKSSISTSIFRYKRLTPPKDKFWADPCVVYHNDTYFIFFEEFVYKENKGYISVMQIDKKGIVSNQKRILEKDYHLSYPFVFKYKGEYYMVPETGRSSTIQLYKAVNFPYEWKFEMNLMENVKAVDTTIFVKDEKVWMFTNIKAIAGAAYDELFLFSSDNLLSKEWQSHPGNPVVSDVKSARCAGRLFYHNNKLYRPSQDCSYRYGYATGINEVLVLNNKEYKERKVSDISPEWAEDILATHTLSSEERLTVIDGLIKRRK
jgi:hypothetical protein